MESTEQIARVCHAAIQAIRVIADEPVKPSWEDATDLEKQLYIDGVEFVMQNPHMSPSDMHDIWMDCKAAQGYTQGDSKCDTAMTSTCFVPFCELSLLEKWKDSIFRNVVTAYMEVT